MTPLIAVDWGTTRFRAALIDGGGIAIARVSSGDGIGSVPAGGFAATFHARCGAWLARFPQARVVMAGMIGSRNGWCEVPYASCPADAGDLGRRLCPADLGDGRQALIVPGLVCETRPGVADVMRGEETLVIGSDIVEGILCLPGTHSKWVRVAGGRIVRFASFVTGEAYALFRHQSLLGRLAEEPEDSAGFARGLGAVGPAGLTHRLFEARTAVLMSRMTGAEVGPFLSGLLIGDEIACASEDFGRPSQVTLVADDPIAGSYAEALAARGIGCTVLAPETALLRGLARIVS